MSIFYDLENEENSFHVLAGSPPTVPTELDRISPDVDRTPEFEWISSIDPDGDQEGITYDLEVYKIGASQTSVLIYNATGISGASSLSAIIDYEVGSTMQDGSYLARVRGVDVDGSGDWTEFVAFDLVYHSIPFERFQPVAPRLEAVKGITFLSGRMRYLYEKLTKK